MSYKKPTPQDLRKANQSEILRKVYFEGPITRLEVSQDLGISPATVTNIVNHLLAENILIESGLKRLREAGPAPFWKSTLPMGTLSVSKLERPPSR